MIIIRNRMAGFLLSVQYSALCIWPFVLVHPDVPEHRLEETLLHERIHARQQTEMLWFFFFIVYGLEFLIRLAQFHNLHRAYFFIAFEREAYEHERDRNYLKRRKVYAWMKYWKKLQ